MHVNGSRSENGFRFCTEKAKALHVIKSNKIQIKQVSCRKATTSTFLERVVKILTPRKADKTKI